ncbi:hypothetical protein SSABA_v1c04160 [Spiroplasma sabaudiense Ar-1343]|uniref:Phosphoadenosine phosphosulphate reductase domain-containing protein n=1 Tax=Spiroplasma sabaudiense Ar-1343 TaxID=1276257 RepID=W6AAF6_9MOLU|nr:phosphoadenosine phosphosulfate reductase family protein [Spiroplasma sabaudiense]AHI53825.1 hypothetical protein SSABA_v1c04160 [Spiroplasma sabaudiense Ar-1343]
MKQSTKEKSEKAIQEIKRIYKRDDSPFLIGYSGGKDSTLTLELVLNALNQIYISDSNLINKVTYVISSDTLIENPFVVNRIKEFEIFSNSPEAKKLKIEFISVKPEVDETFWTLLIGRGYPLPLNRFRWCTRHLKINPIENNTYKIQEKHPTVINVLGIRRNESAVRRSRIEKSQIDNEYYLFQNFEEERNIIFAPIIDFEIHDLWNYLRFIEKSFWGSNLNILYQMYQDSSKECLNSFDMKQVDNKGDSCGNSRWGCWVCPLSNKIWIDNMHSNGIQNLEPVVKFRKLLLSERDKQINRYAGKHVRRSNGTYSLGIRGWQKLKFDEENNAHFIPKKGIHRERVDVVINDVLQKKYKILESTELNKNLAKKIYNDEKGLTSAHFVKKVENEYFVLAPGPYTIKYRANILRRLIELRETYKDLEINSGIEYAKISIISDSEISRIKELLLLNAKAISEEKLNKLKIWLEG